MQHIILLMVSAGLLLACDSANNHLTNQGKTMTPFHIKAGMSVQNYNQRNHIYRKKSVDKQPAGLNFHEQNWSIKDQGTVRVDHGQYSFTIPYVLGSTGVEDTEHLDRGIIDFNIKSGITPDEFIDHDEARIKFMNLIQNLTALGWQHYIQFHSDPRLSGRQSFLYTIMEDIGYGPDPTYIPDYEEWMAARSGIAWTLHADDIFLKVSFRRDSDHMEDNKPGVYLLSFQLLTREERAREYYTGKNREQWLDIWGTDAKKEKIWRYEKEVELIEKGYHINTDYIEPKIHPDDPFEPEGEAVEALLEIINNQPPPAQP